MGKRFFSEEAFIDNYDEEIDKALGLYELLTEKGIRENVLCTLDFDFGSDKRSKLESLRKFLIDNYDFTVDEVKKSGKFWTLAGTSIEQPLNEERLVYWALDLYSKGYEFDCELTGYGTLTDSKQIEFLNLENYTAEDFYKKGIGLIAKRNFGAAIICFSVALGIEPTSAKTWYAKGYCKEQIYSYGAARSDYDEALRLDPTFVDVLIARGANKDEQGEFEEALEDYNRVIEIEPNNHVAYYNRGNTKFNMGDKTSACEDWLKAKSLGSPYAQERITAECE